MAIGERVVGRPEKQQNDQPHDKQHYSLLLEPNLYAKVTSRRTARIDVEEYRMIADKYNMYTIPWRTA